MKNKILPLLLLLAINAGILLQLNAAEDFRLCKGFTAQNTLVLGSVGIGLSNDPDLSIGWNVIKCCKPSNAMNWCDFNLENKACETVVSRDSSPVCITGSIAE